MDLAYLALLACPIMMVIMVIAIMKMSGNNNSSSKTNQDKELKENLNTLVQQNQALAKEIEDLKRSR
ncbi:DUF2933 domain-containing protein [Evansella sp. AB-P1]|uniref:DUF2933 domain-containing protein n=1 Tax=Evansella sp. AB-P1 TaxID=3037653 RepID=UPI00241D009C|nr:DUF2933 domain-containing protein [Evansella sp. AB-P1]MDG5787241.1 DUF2933 domain-containing protein [Evansella sp. AB-P1]